MRFTPILQGYQHDSYNKMTSLYAEYGITPPPIYFLTLELKQSKTISSHSLPRTIASLAAFAALILTPVLAGILIALPVAGLRSIRAFLLNRTSFPIPDREYENGEKRKELTPKRL